MTGLVKLHEYYSHAVEALKRRPDIPVFIYMFMADIVV